VETKVLLATMRFATAGGQLLTAVGVILGSFWAHDHLGRYWSWDPREIGAAALLGWNGLVLWMLVGRRDERIGMLLGLAGVVVVASCWFVPALVRTESLHDYGRLTAAVVAGIAGFAIVPAALCGLVALPPGRLQRSEQ